MPDFPAGAEEGHEVKRRIRGELLARRRALDPGQREEAAGRVLAELTALVRRVRPGRVAAYVPVGSEPGGPELPDRLRDLLPGRTGLLLPVLREDLDLDWAEYRGSLVAAGRGMREPTGPRLGVTALAGVDLVLVPALGVDRRGVRLGRGGGSYDRALARVPAGTPTVALLHEGELLDRLPAEPHDRPVGAALTPGGGVTPLPAGSGVGPHTSAGRTRVR